MRRDLPEGEYNYTTSQKLVYMPDQLGSVRDVLDATTGNLVASYDYTPYGTIAQSNVTNGTDYQYAGLFAHAASGLNLATYRAQDGVTGRWLNRDPIGEAGGINLYGYMGANPPNGIDPWGFAAHENMLDPKRQENPNLYPWAQSYKPKDYNTVVVHGGPNGNFAASPNLSKPISPQTVANTLKGNPDYDPNLPTLIIACQASNGSGAQNVANALGAPVYASPVNIQGNAIPGGPPLQNDPNTNRLIPVIWGPPILPNNKR